MSHSGCTFEEDTSKQSSSPTLERPMRIRDRGRREAEGTVASNRVMGGTIPLGVVDVDSGDRRSKIRMLLHI